MNQSTPSDRVPPAGSASVEFATSDFVSDDFRAPNDSERTKMASALRISLSSSVESRGRHVAEFLWSRHFFREEEDLGLFISQNSQRSNRYCFHLEAVPNGAFWEVYRYLDLD